MSIFRESIDLLSTTSWSPLRFFSILGGKRLAYLRISNCLSKLGFTGEAKQKFEVVAIFEEEFDDVRVGSKEELLDSSENHSFVRTVREMFM